MRNKKKIFKMTYSSFFISLFKTPILKNSELLHNQLFCSKPFEWFEVTTIDGRGTIFLCCPNWLNKPIGNIQYQSIDEIWNGKRAQAIRQSILNGTFEYCDYWKCAHLQSKTGPVKRIGDINEPVLKEIIKKKLTKLPYGPRKIICTFDLSCNLSCPSCRERVIIETDHEQEILTIQNIIETEALKNADYIHITGSGDPFGSPYSRKWLVKMNRENMSSIKQIHLHTNALLWTPNIWKTIPSDIRKLITSADIGIDAATPFTYTINRRGGNFEQLLYNLEFISKLRKDDHLKFLKISMVIQANNFREMPEFIRLGNRFGVDQIYFGQLVNWGTFSEEEFKARAVHEPCHPLHNEFIQLLRDEIFDQEKVYLGNLTHLRRLK